MKARIHAITLGVSDLERSLTFYRALGLTSPGIGGTEFPGDSVNPGGTVAMFTLDDGLILSLYPRSELAKDVGVDPANVTGSPFTIGHGIDAARTAVASLRIRRERLAPCRVTQHPGHLPGHLDELRVHPAE
jgi:uncharacterized protein